MIQIIHFTKQYGGGKKAVDDLNLTIEAGDIYGFIGHNGAGKSTTIRAIAGVLDFDEGEILIDGHSIKEEPVACKQIMAYIPDNPDLYDHLTGIQYLNLVGDMFSVEKKKREERIKRYGDLFGIINVFGDLISSYSHGMKQKLAIFFSTHVLEVAEKLCNKIAIIKAGRLVESGEMETVVQNQSLEEVFMEVVENEQS